MVASPRRLHCIWSGIGSGFVQPLIYLQFLLLMVAFGRNLFNFVAGDGRMADVGRSVMLHNYCNQMFTII